MSIRELARLVHGRHAHACGAYNVAGAQVQLIAELPKSDPLKSFLTKYAQMLIVAGGTHLGNKLKSTEVVKFPDLADTLLN